MPNNLTSKPDDEQSSPTRTNHAPLALLIGFTLVIAIVALLTQSDRFQKQESFSEFYIRDTQNLLSSNNLEIVQSQEILFTAAIVNHEGATSSYRVLVMVNSQLKSTVSGITVKDNEVNEIPLAFSMPTSGDNQRVDILLEKQGSKFPYRALHLLVNVKPSVATSPVIR